MQRSILAVAAVLAGLSTTGALAQGAGDPEAGKTVFKKCQACHAVGAGAANKIGPELNGIMGEKPGAVEGYSFSAGFKEWAADKPAWNTELMSAWLANPKAVVKTTKMAFPGLKKPEEITNVIAYLATFDEAGAAQDPAAALKAVDGQ
ncbi:cytochrome c family protein [Aurantimonas sp. Leaf443]|uniref:c-type cytochrome n=1 Tax=Aurantimonas sp. Leaf443 TaxID=1736378 RepID=UPI000701BBFB|nr:cytochrome c family protein [Aurantimonas sp. Leaf443]KQT85956.1 cytochrome c [Aurantimonas sp. Leaf443]